MHLFFAGRACFAPVAMIAACALLSGCVAYRAEPIDWEREQANWQNAHSETLTPSLADALVLANAMNPEINSLRLRQLNRKREADASGWWNDPEIGLDVSRLIESAAKPWTIGAGAVFTIPLTGVPGLEKKALLAYTESGVFEIVAAEKKLEASVRAAWLELSTAHELLALLEEHAATLGDALATSEKLDEAGECAPEQIASLRLAAIALKTETASARADVVLREGALKELIGLHPATRAEFPTDAEWRVGDAAWRSEAELTAHPAVAAKLRLHDVAEWQLRAEIRKQYPELMLGASGENDQGDASFGVSFGVTLPAWNRNRRGIATARGARDEAKAECVATWKMLVHTLYRQRAEFDAARAELEQTETVALPTALTARDKMAKLEQFGEADSFALYEAQCAVLDVRQTLVAQRAKCIRAGIDADGEMTAVFTH